MQNKRLRQKTCLNFNPSRNNLKFEQVPFTMQRIQLQLNQKNLLNAFKVNCP